MGGQYGQHTEAWPRSHKLTRDDGLPVALPGRTNSDKLLAQVRRHVCVAVHKDPDGLLQRHRRQVLHLEAQTTQANTFRHTGGPSERPGHPKV